MEEGMSFNLFMLALGLGAFLVSVIIAAKFFRVKEIEAQLRESNRLLRKMAGEASKGDSPEGNK